MQKDPRDQYTLDSHQTIRKFFQDVMQQESLTGQVTQIRCNADPTTHAFLMFNTESERNHFVKTLRRSQHVGGWSTRPIQFHDDLPWEERNISKQPGHAKYHIHCEMGIEFSQIFIDRETKSLQVRREIVAKTWSTHESAPNQESMDGWTKSKTNTGDYAVITVNMEHVRLARARLQAI